MSQDGLNLGKWSRGGGGVVRALGELQIVSRPEDFGPCDEFGMIALANSAYQIVKSIDLGACRLVANSPVTIFGTGAEAVTLSASALDGEAIITASDTIQLRTMSMSCNATSVCVRCAGSGGTAALDWVLVNFLGPGRAGEMTDINNFIGDTIGVLGGGGFHFFGTSNTIAFDLSIFVVASGEFGIKMEPGSVCNRRLRLTDSSVIALGGGTGLSVQDANIANSEAYALGGVNFSGGGSFIEGLDYADDKSRFTECRGIINSTRLGVAYWDDNALVTTIDTAGVFVKINTVSTPSPDNQRFTHSAGRLTYASAFQTTFILSAAISVTAGNVQENRIALAFYKNGAFVPGSQQTVLTRNNGSARNITLQTAVGLEDGDYIEVWCTNLDNNSNLTATQGNILARVITN